MEQQEPGPSSSPTIKNPSGKYVRSRQRKIIANLYNQMVKEQPHKKSSDPALSTYERNTLHRILHNLNFKFFNKRRNSALRGKNNIVLWRHNYLIKLAKYKAEGRHIYYLDETWLNIGDCHNKMWVDTTIQSSRDAQERGLSTGILEPTGKGKRLIVLHIGSIEGFVPEGLLCFETKKNSIDYHDEMNGDTFFEWFQKILPSLKEGSVIVMDNAPYHSVKAERCPTMNWTKQQIIDWLISKGCTAKKEERFMQLDQIIDEVNDINILQSPASQENSQSENCETHSSKESQ